MTWKTILIKEHFLNSKWLSFGEKKENNNNNFDYNNNLALNE